MQDPLSCDSIGTCLICSWRDVSQLELRERLNAILVFLVAAGTSGTLIRDIHFALLGFVRSVVPFRRVTSGLFGARVRWLGVWPAAGVCCSAILVWFLRSVSTFASGRTSFRLLGLLEQSFARVTSLLPIGICS
jgi:hypothetical protein